MLAADFLKNLKVLAGWYHDAALTENRFHDDGGDRLWLDVAPEDVLQVRGTKDIAGWVGEIVRATEAIGIGNAVNLWCERTHSRLVGSDLACEGQREKGAAVKSVFETEDRRSTGVGAGDLDGVLDALGAAVGEKSLLLPVDRSELVEAFREAEVDFIRSHVKAGMGESIDLLLDRCHDLGGMVADVEYADTTREVDQAIAIDIFYQSPLGPGDIYRRDVEQPARYGLFSLAM
jgi:hypothetical protein